MAVVLGACGSSSTVSSSAVPPGGTTGAAPVAGVPTTGGPATTVPGVGAAPAPVPVVGAAGAGLQRLAWDSVVSTTGRTVVLLYARGGCTGPALQATVTEAAASVGVALWDRPRQPGQVCADFVTQALVSVVLPSDVGGRAVRDV